jgi:hypothetical protein
MLFAARALWRGWLPRQGIAFTFIQCANLHAVVLLLFDLELRTGKAIGWKLFDSITDGFAGGIGEAPISQSDRSSVEKSRQGRCSRIRPCLSISLSLDSRYITLISRLLEGECTNFGRSAHGK